jgi:hypothetical protein
MPGKRNLYLSEICNCMICLLKKTNKYHKSSDKRFTENLTIKVTLLIINIVYYGKFQSHFGNWTGGRH